MPIGFTADGMPLSLQVIGRPMAEATVLRVADAFQRVTDHHRRRPPLRSESLGTMMPKYLAAPAPAPAEHVATHVDALLQAAALDPPEDDRAAIIAGYEELRRSADGLYRSLGEIDPILAFDAMTPTRVDRHRNG